MNQHIGHPDDFNRHAKIVELAEEIYKDATKTLLGQLKIVDYTELAEKALTAAEAFAIACERFQPAPAGTTQVRGALPGVPFVGGRK